MIKPAVATILKKEQFNLRGVFVSTYIPRHCGIATYTKDLTNAINVLNPDSISEIMAMDDPREPVTYPWEVKFRINREEEKDYLEAANYINKSSCDYVSLQHEFGIYGGKSGEYILNLVRSVKKPVVTTFHTTLKKPNNEQNYIIKKLANYSEACVVMIAEAAQRLKKNYGVPAEKVVIVPHGVPNIAFSPAQMFKKDIEINKKAFIIGSINLIAANKGLEYVIQALPIIKKIKPDVKFLMIGETHPLVKTEADENYRLQLRQLSKKLKLQDNFIEINQYLSLDDLLRYLKALDVYITPYLDLSQTSSGTLAYAIGAGKVCVSTPYIYAQETLAEGRGIFVNKRNPVQIAEAIIEIMQTPKKRDKIEKAVYAYGRHMIWERVALDYLNLFSYVVNK